MDLPASPVRGLLTRTETRLAGFGLVAVLAVYLGFFGVSVSLAEAFIKHAGYYVMLLTFGWWIWSLWRIAPAGSGSSGSLRERVAAGLLILTFTGVSVAQESFRSKILYDEFVLQATAFNMHFFRDVATMVRGYDILGTFLSTDNYLDKRPYFFPFLISLVHDLTGYRPLNAYLVNTVLHPLTLGLAYGLGRALTGWRGGVLAVCLLGSLPLFAQNATGSGMELLNLAMLLAVVALAAGYLARPDEARLSALLLAAVLLAQCRYESALYILPVALVVLAGWWRTRRITLSWTAVAIPALLLPVALHNMVLSHSPILWEMKANQTSRFGAEYVAGNLREAWSFLFSSRPGDANSLFLSWLGGLAVLGIAGWLVRHGRRSAAIEPTRLAWLHLSLGILINTALVMFYFWSSFTDPMAARFCLPLYLLLVFAAVLLAGWLDRRMPASAVLFLVAGASILGYSVPKEARHQYSHLGIDEVEWEKRYVAARPYGERLILTNKSTLPWLLQKTPAILLNRARLVADRLRYQLDEPTFREILVTQELRPTTVEGEHQIVSDDFLPATYHLELLAEKRFGTKIARISRLVAVDVDPAASPP